MPEEREGENKNPPQTSAATYELPQIFSPWCMPYHTLSPNYSPYFMNVPSFSSFDASIGNQFYNAGLPNKNNLPNQQ